MLWGLKKPGGEEPMVLKVKTTTPFIKIYTAVATERGIDVKSFRLQFEGQTLRATDATPQDVRISPL